MSEKNVSSRLHSVLPYIGVVLGVLILASPAIADSIETWRANNTISEATSVIEQIPEEDKEELLHQAQMYNEQLATHEINDEVWPYERQLSWDPSQVMCWVEIPRIDVRLGVYHGTDDSELMVGAGHLDFTSLPVGGASTHCALSAHSGMPTARMFDDVSDLVPGDMFVIWTLGDPYAYRVTDILSVDPDDLSLLEIEDGKDLCTLITCIPYGINSQRLLVRGERCAYEEVVQEPPIMYVSPRIWPLVAGLVLAGGALALISLHVLRRKGGKGRRAKREERTGGNVLMSAREQQRGQSGDAKASASLGSRIVRILPYIGVLVGLLLIVAPALLDCFTALRANSEISSLSSTVSALSAEKKEYLLEQAHRYNAVLSGEAAGEVDQVAAEQGLLPYDQQLRTDSTSVMAWLEIPSIDLSLPIYHGTGDSELAAGVGHLQDTSLPVGGASTHCALTAHSGMAASRMFDDIRLLQPGDVFVLWTLGDPLAYEVTSCETVLPEEVESIGIEQGEDLCTLVTCTPYGVNSHRLLVHAHRCAYQPEAIVVQPAHVSSRFWPVAAALAAVAATVIALVAWRVHRKRRGSKTGR